MLRKFLVLFSLIVSGCTPLQQDQAKRMSSKRPQQQKQFPPTLRWSWS